MRKIFVLTLILFGSFLMHAQLSTVIGKTDYPFWVNVPVQKVMDGKVPIIIFLHGKSLSGTDINRVKRYGILRAIEKGRKIPALVIAPQLASGAWNPDKVLEVLKYVQKNYKTDLSRVYVCGMSLGAYGTMHFAGKYPHRITAAVAICGGGNEKDACMLGKIPLWIQHGDKDFVVPLSESKKIVNAIKGCNPKADVKFTIIPGGNHSNVENLFREDAIYDWMLKQKK
ncbi:dienelactone hydrolase family protein [Flavobacterium sp. GT3R68]|uniref:carboxylesterase family protein n=1 Tax=Flavobacterium sp. GT3R68 TaxID=2594437 RepID=UPI000F8817B8|nr:dienelactone hydrolase family protein [Flavobacterium sp. GT3R68]RTY88576.1 phospholipase [Flavobacterium sp. GSN2]TRW90609.1 phospholipase [Flavobacterium sp. GT3R68]